MKMEIKNEQATIEEIIEVISEIILKASINTNESKDVEEECQSQQHSIVV
jgi:hypothetical protein